MEEGTSASSIHQKVHKIENGHKQQDPAAIASVALASEFGYLVSSRTFGAMFDSACGDGLDASLIDYVFELCSRVFTGDQESREVFKKMGLSLQLAFGKSKGQRMSTFKHTFQTAAVVPYQ